MKRILITVVLGLVYGMVPGATPVITVSPGNTVDVGQEVLLDASASTGVTDRAGCTYAWDFGDGRSSGVAGVAVPHFYMRPGTFTVTLSLTDNGATTTASAAVTVTGNYTRVPARAASPALSLKFESSLDDSSGNGLHGAWGAGTGTYIDGIEKKSLDLTGGRYATVAGFTRLNNQGAFTVVLWARRAAASGAYHLMALGNIFSLRVGSEDVLVADVTTTSGSSQAQAWYCGSLNTAWHQYALVYDGARVRLFADGQERFFMDRCPKARTGSTGAANTALFIGSNSSGGSVFNGYMDEVRIYDRTLTEKEIGVGFELWRAHYEGRIRQYVYAQIPGEITAVAANRLRVTLSDGVNDQVLLDKADLAEEETFLVDQSGLAQGTYTVTARLLDGSGGLLDEIVEHFNKPFNGLPGCGLDENNAFRVNGQLLFPVTSFCNNDADIVGWGQNKYINVAQGKGWWPTDAGVSAWTNYMNLAQQGGLYSMGPLRWNNSTNWKNFDRASLESYISASQDHPTMLGYAWGDEPDLGDNQQRGPGTALRAIHYLCHTRDPQHLTLINFAGGTWLGSGWAEGLRKANYNYLHNANQFGKKTLVHDVYSFDYYPIEWAAPSVKNATLAQLVTIIDNLRVENYDLVPLFSYVETCDIREPDWGTTNYPTPWHPTPAQLRMVTWINVVHGVKGISWFPYHSGTPAENYPVMTQFVDQITRLAPAVLGPELDNRLVTIAPEGGARIDHMVRVYNDTLFVFTVRVSESNTSGQSIGSQQNATITLPTAVTASSATVFEENRTVSISSHAITDTFNVNSVHIYKVYSPEVSVRTRPLPVTKNLPGLAVSPNPCVLGQEVFIRAGQAAMFVTIHTLCGKHVGEVPLMQGNGAWQAGTNGVYLVKTADGKTVQKFMVVK